VQLYENDLDKIDVMVGLLSEPPLPGFVFGESIYSIFLLQVGVQGQMHVLQQSNRHEQHGSVVLLNSCRTIPTWMSCCAAYQMIVIHPLLDVTLASETSPAAAFAAAAAATNRRSAAQSLIAS
jgi:hypothetical protein